MLLGHENAIIDCPTLYTFHGAVSSTKGFKIGSSPWDESCKKKRKSAGTALARPALRNYHPMFDFESYCILRDMYRGSSNGAVEPNIRPYIQRYPLNKTLTLLWHPHGCCVRQALARNSPRRVCNFPLMKHLRESPGLHSSHAIFLE